MTLTMSGTTLEMAGRMSRERAVLVLAQEHARDAFHIYNDPLHRGTRCEVCAALIRLRFGRAAVR